MPYQSYFTPHKQLLLANGPKGLHENNKIMLKGLTCILIYIFIAY